jgi:hypothetical protein
MRVFHCFGIDRRPLGGGRLGFGECHRVGLPADGLAGLSLLDMRHRGGINFASETRQLDAIVGSLRDPRACRLHPGRRFVCADVGQVVMNLPWLEIAPVDPCAFEEIRREAIFACCKWDPQVEDVSTLSPLPIVPKKEVWNELRRWAERLAGELAAAEDEILARPQLHKALGLPRAVLSALKEAKCLGLMPHPRLVRFDFHYTTSGWKISEANTDVPGRALSRSNTGW